MTCSAAQELTEPASRLAPDELAEALAGGLGDADVVAHRIVHGGERFQSAVVIDDEVVERSARTRRARAAASAEVARRARGRVRRAARPARGRVL